MRLKRDIAYDIRREIRACDQFRFLNDKENRPLLKEACCFLLQEIIGSMNITPDERITVIGPETMGAHMISMVDEAINDGTLAKFPNLSTGILRKQKQDYFRWGGEAPTNCSTTIWMDDTLRHANTIQKASTILERSRMSLSAVAVLADYAYLGQKLVPANLIFSIEQRRTPD